MKKPPIDTLEASSNVEFSRPLEDSISSTAIISSQERLKKTENKNLVIAIDIGTDLSNPNKQKAKAYVNSQSKNIIKEKKLSCLILNNLMTDLKIDDISIISLNYPNNKYTILTNQNSPTIILEIGNIYYDKNTNILSDTSKIAKSVYKGVETYYN